LKCHSDAIASEARSAESFGARRGGAAFRRAGELLPPTPRRGRDPGDPIERSSDRIWAGLVERTDPPASGEVVLHMGSGLTCYVELAGDGPYPKG
jgi:hypothetical protein